MVDIRVFIIDDNDLVLQGLESLLTAALGVSVIDTFTEPCKAIAAYKAKHPDVLLIDVNMPELNGFETALHILKLDPQARILLLSLEVNEFYIQKALKMGVKGFLSKTDDIDHIIYRIKQVYQPPIATC